MPGSKPKLPTAYSIYGINQLILDQYPDIWIHKIDEDRGLLTIVVSGISEREREDLVCSLYDHVPAGIKILVKLASTRSEFFKAEPISRPNAPWKDIT